MVDIHAQFKGVQKSYDGESLVVEELDLEIESGEFLTMLGPSGSGKTTCLMMLAGFETVTRGEIFINGQAINRIPPHKRGIGMVFQNYALFPHMTVFENLVFPLQVRKIPKADADKKVKRALEMVQLNGFEGRRPGQLSGGQQQRVAVARALVFEPSLVLMDEPLGALDKNLREKMQYELKHIHENLGVTVVYVTHDQSEALTMSNRVAVFNEGRIQQLAPPNILYEKPENAFVAQFIGENNRFCGEVVDIKDGLCRVRADNGAEINAVNICAELNKKANLSLRPERVQVGQGSDYGENQFTAKLMEKIYLGDHIRFRFSLLGNDEFIVKVPNSGGLSDINVGNEVPVAWKSKDCRALDPPAA